MTLINTVICRIGVGFFVHTRFLRTDFAVSFCLHFIHPASLVLTCLNVFLNHRASAATPIICGLMKSGNLATWQPYIGSDQRLLHWRPQLAYSWRPIQISMPLGTTALFLIINFIAFITVVITNHSTKVLAIEFVMFEAAILGLDNILNRYSWARELAGVLPLSAFIDFIDLTKLHIFELTGGSVPLWSWPVTPSGGRFLLSDEYMQKSCCLDRYGRSSTFMVMNGRSGYRNFAANPETVRMCMSSQRVNKIQNDHMNKSNDEMTSRNLEIVHISEPYQDDLPQQLSWLRRILVSAMGWIILLGMIIMSGILQCFLSVAFLMIIPVTGVVIFYLYGRRPRKLGEHHAFRGKITDAFNSFCIVAEPINSMNGTVFYGDSKLIGSFLNRPLEPSQPPIHRFARGPLLMVLRILIVGQWGLILGAAALKDWNGYFIAFWIIFCIFSHTYLFSTYTSINSWTRSYANIKLERYQTELTSGIALLTTIIALNPHTFPFDRRTKQEDRKKFDERAMKWVNRIWEPGTDRTVWEDATRTGMNNVPEDISTLTPESLAKSLSVRAECPPYWTRDISEGILMAARIKKETNLIWARGTEYHVNKNGAQV